MIGSPNAIRIAIANPRIKAVLALLALAALLGPPAALALEPSLDINQYAHTAWTIRDNFLKGAVVEQVPWSKLGGNVTASAVIPDPMRGGLWLGFFQGGLVHFKDGQVRASYGKNEGLGAGRVMDLQLNRDGTLWAATEGGLSHLKDGHIATITTGNGLPCDTVHWAMELDSSFWLYTACGLLRIPRTELEKWVSDPATKIHFTIFDNTDGVRCHALLTGYTPGSASPQRENCGSRISRALVW